MLFDQSCGRCRMYQPVAVEHAHCRSAKAAIFWHQPRHHQRMCPQQVIDGIRIERQHQFVCLISVFHFTDFIGIAQYPLARDDGRHLFQRKGIVFNGKRGMNRPDAVFAPQMRTEYRARLNGYSAQPLADFRHEAQHVIGQGKGRLVLAHDYTILNLTAHPVFFNAPECLHMQPSPAGIATNSITGKNPSGRLRCAICPRAASAGVLLAAFFRWRNARRCGAFHGRAGAGSRAAIPC